MVEEDALRFRSESPVVVETRLWRIRNSAVIFSITTQAKLWKQPSGNRKLILNITKKKFSFQKDFSTFSSFNDTIWHFLPILERSGIGVIGQCYPALKEKKKANAFDL